MARLVGDNPPFHKPTFVLTHHQREPLTLSDTTFTFVTDGIESALEQARQAARGKDVIVGGGADAINQYLLAGLVDEIELHVVPILLGAGARLAGIMLGFRDLGLGGVWPGLARGLGPALR